MKYPKYLLAFMFPLMMMLGSFSIYLLVNKIVENYKQKVSKDYSIIIITNEPVLDFNKLSPIQFQKVDKINRKNIINDLKNSASQLSLDILSKQLPYFYEAYLEDFSTNEELKEIKRILTKLDSVREVEIFETDHTNLYSLLILTKKIVTILSIIVLTSSFLMLLQQIKIVVYEYSEKISILQLLGASFTYSTKDIVRTVLISILISLLSVFTLMYLIIINFSSVLQIEFLQIIPTFQDMYSEFFLIIISAFIAPFIAFGTLIVKHRINNDI